MGEAVVILPPDRRGDQQVQRRDRRAPGSSLQIASHFACMVEHGIDHVDKRFVGGEEAVAAGEQIAFQPAFERVLGEHFHHAAVGRKLTAVGVFGKVVGKPELLLTS